MDALRRAEQQKQESDRQPPDGLALEPLASGPGAADRKSRDGLPELPQRLEDLDEQFLAHAPARPERADRPAPGQSASATATSPNDDEQAARDLARNLFAVKQPAPAGLSPFALVVGVSTLVAIIVLGGYLYWQMQPKGGLGTGPALSQQRPSPPPAPAALSTAVPPAPTPPTPSAAPIAPPQVAAQPDAQPAPALPRRAAMKSAGAAGNTAASITPGAPAAATESGIRLAPTAARADTALDNALQAFERGETERARHAWQKVLQADRQSLDALHGLAALAVREGRTTEAGDYYQRALLIDPKDALALSGWLALQPATDPRQSESRLKTLLAEQPDSPHLHFALGNVYSQEQRWAEAQQAYFKAHVADAANPDYLYNLAVSLDHLHQARLAAQYYERALAATAQQPAGFDRGQVQTRLNKLRAGGSRE